MGSDRGQRVLRARAGRGLVRTNTRPTRGQALRIPESLQELLGERLGRLPTDTGDVLLQVAALAHPTIEVVARAHGDEARVLEALEAAVHESVVELTDRTFGSRIRCSPRFATSRRRSGSGAPSIAHWPEWSRTSRSRPAIWPSRRKGPTPASPPNWRQQPSRLRHAGRPELPPSSTTSPQSSRRTTPHWCAAGASRRRDVTALRATSCGLQT